MSTALQAYVRKIPNPNKSPEIIPVFNVPLFSFSRMELNISTAFC